MNIFDSDLEDADGSFSAEMTVSDAFNENFDNLRKDINAIDLMLASVQKHIVVIEAQIKTIENAIKNANNSGADKSKLYHVLNNAQDLLTRYFDTFNKYSDTKYKYRKEQNDLKFKITRMAEIELKGQKELPSTIEMMETLKKLQFSSGQLKHNVQNELSKLSDDPIYEL